ncbi:retention module-containing protein, partial [Franzmannia qiaohouensis]
MAIATVLSITGQAWARDADGNLRELSVGDILVEGETLVTSDNGSVQLDFLDGLDPTMISGGQEIAMTPDVDVNAPVDVADSEVLDADLEALLAAIDDDEVDLLDVLDPTAAGAGGGAAADGGHGFVRLARITEGVDPLAFEFGSVQTTEFTTPEGEPAPVDELEADAALDEPETEPEPEPTVSITNFEIGSTNNSVSSLLNGTSTNATTVDVTLTGPNGAQTFTDIPVDEDGNWSLDLGSDLPEGDYSVEVIARDGN